MVEPPTIDAELPKLGRCPICKAEADAVFRPFCSKRCSDVDLHRWLSGRYAIPDEATPLDQDAIDPADPDASS